MVPFHRFVGETMFHRKLCAVLFMISLSLPSIYPSCSPNSLFSITSLQLTMLATKCSAGHNCRWASPEGGSTIFYAYSSHADTDECATNNGGCEFNCTNTIGNFNCSCPTGYHLDEDGFNCNGESFLIMLLVGK